MAPTTMLLRQDPIDLALRTLPRVSHSEGEREGGGEGEGERESLCLCVRERVPYSAISSDQQALGEQVTSSIQEQLLRRSMKWFRIGLVFQAHRHAYHSTLGSTVIKKNMKSSEYDQAQSLNQQL